MWQALNFQATLAPQEPGAHSEQSVVRNLREEGGEFAYSRFSAI